MFRSSKLVVSNWFDLLVVCFSLLGVVVGHQLMELGGGAGRGQMGEWVRIMRLMRSLRLLRALEERIFEHGMKSARQSLFDSFLDLLSVLILTVRGKGYMLAGAASTESP